MLNMRSIRIIKNDCFLKENNLVNINISSKALIFKYDLIILCTIQKYLTKCILII